MPLDVHVLGYASSANPFLFNRHLEERVLDVITRYSDGKSTIVFCESKKVRPLIPLSNAPHHHHHQSPIVQPPKHTNPHTQACESLAYKLAAAASTLGPRPSKDASDRFASIGNPKLRCVVVMGTFCVWTL